MRSGPPAGCGWVSGYAGQRHCRADQRPLLPLTTAPNSPLVSLYGAPVSDDQGRSTRREIARRPIMTADVLCDEGVVKESARFQLRRGAMFPAAGDAGAKPCSESELRRSLKTVVDPRAEGGPTEIPPTARSGKRGERGCARGARMQAVQRLKWDDLQGGMPRPAA